MVYWVTVSVIASVATAPAARARAAVMEKRMLKVEVVKCEAHTKSCKRMTG